MYTIVHISIMITQTTIVKLEALASKCIIFKMENVTYYNDCEFVVLFLLGWF